MLCVLANRDRSRDRDRMAARCSPDHASCMGGGVDPSHVLFSIQFENRLICTKSF